FLLAKDLFGEKVALWAVLWCVFPSQYLLDFSLNPQGGYIETICLGSMVLWLSIRLIRAKSEVKRAWLYFALGLSGGFAWWTSPLTSYYLMSSALFILLIERRRIFFWRGALALIGFILGSLPFWIYHIRHHIGLGGFSGGFQLKYMGAGLVQLFFYNIPKLLGSGLQANPVSISILLMVFFALSFVVFFRESYRDFINLFSFRKKELTGQSILLLFFFVVCLIYSTSQMGSLGNVRYLLVLFSLVPIMVGLFLKWISRFWKPLPWIIMMGLISLHIPLFFESQLKVAPYVKSRNDALKQLGQAILDVDINRAYAGFQLAGKLSFLSDEKLIVSTPVHERYQPYQDILEASNQVAYIFEGRGDIPEALSTIGGTSSIMRMGSFTVYHDFSEPRRRYRQIIPHQWSAGPGSHSSDLLATFDRDYDHVWSEGREDENDSNFTLDLGQVYTIGKIRMMNRVMHFKNYPERFLLETSVDGQQWQLAIKSDGFYSYYWSGPRLYAWSLLFRWELCFDAIKAHYLRIRRLGEQGKHAWEINEIFVYEDVGDVLDPKEDLDTLLEFIVGQEFDFIYADRWMSAIIREHTGSRIKVLPTFIDSTFKRNEIPSILVHFGPRVGFVLDEADAEAFQIKMQENDIQVERKIFGRHILFYFLQWPDESELRLKKDQSYVWTGFCVLDCNLASRSQAAAGLAGWLMERGQNEDADKWYSYAIRTDPDNIDALRGNAIMLHRFGKYKESQKNWRQLYQETIPENSAFCRFSDGVEFIGYTLAKDEVSPGDQVSINYYWKIDKRQADNWFVFVHFANNQFLFQNDHPLTNQFRDDDMVISETQVLDIPKDTTPGVYEIGLGIYEGTSNARRKVVKTHLPHKKGKVIVGKLRVQSTE
ncbi:MAG: hypothetical protein Q8Q33_00270, partial [Chlamydiota bacterium]|nr:hypothetical protein [Chlamydiota bacterium]